MLAVTPLVSHSHAYHAIYGPVRTRRYRVRTARASHRYNRKCCRCWPFVRVGRFFAALLISPRWEVRRARLGPGLWPGPRRQARWAGRGLRRSRAGPEDRFCEAVRNDLRVPLTLEGPTRIMRGVPALVAVTLSRR